MRGLRIAIPDRRENELISTGVLSDIQDGTVGEPVRLASAKRVHWEVTRAAAAFSATD